MTRLIRTNLTPIALFLLAVLPAVMGMSPGVVRCEHPGAETHLAVNDHHVLDDTDCCEHDTPDDPGQPADEAPCNDLPLDIELAPAPQAPQLDLGFVEAPALPFIIWAPADQADTLPDATFPIYDLGPPELSARLAVVASTVLRL